MSELKTIDSNYFQILFSFLFSFSFILYFILDLELRVSMSYVTITVTGSHGMMKDIEGHRTNNII